MDFGSTLRAAREQRGLTTSQVAAQTHILVQIIEGMECNDFRLIAAPIYGRGFVKLICECLGLETNALIAEFMAAYSGAPQHGDPAGQSIVSTVHRVSPMPAPEPASAPEPAAEPAEAPLAEPVPESVADVPEDPPAAEEEPATITIEEEPVEPAPSATEAPPKAMPAPMDNSLRGLELFDQALGTEPPKTAPEPAAPSVASENFAGITSAYDSPAPQARLSPLERFRSGLSSISQGMMGQLSDMPQRPLFRLALLAIVALLVLALVGWGITALFRATASAPTPAAEVEVSEPTTTTPDEPAPKADAEPIKATVPIKLPPFYVD